MNFACSSAQATISSSYRVGISFFFSQGKTLETRFVLASKGRMQEIVLNLFRPLPLQPHQPNPLQASDRVLNRDIDKACVGCECNCTALLFDSPLPARAPSSRLELPLQQMREQHSHSIGEFASFAFPHVFDLVCNVCTVEQIKLPATDKFRLFIRPGYDVLFV